jgi:hypothetical protein
MPKKTRDDFTAGVKRTIAERAAYICTNPVCRKPTVGPHSNPNKSLKIGEAAHICAAAPGGPRYDPTQTAVERSSINNAIWMCTECSTRVDKDEVEYPDRLLREWKHNHESRIADGEIVPSLPDLAAQQLVCREHSTILARFLTEAQQLRSRMGETPLPIDDHNQWVDRVSEYLRDQLGDSYEVRFSDFSGLKFYGDGSDKSAFSRSLDGRTRRLHEFIKEVACQ